MQVEAVTIEKGLSDVTEAVRTVKNVICRLTPVYICTQSSVSAPAFV